ncbi:SdpI family protein [Propionibacterium freudenreichii]|uniref:SdpI family protein n=1 Tax=Propionibacterium freudenreichii TaxID=1744 RepID=UPI0021A69698|nr:SdpI family protein [Propionibacterium freudenreichii]
MLLIAMGVLGQRHALPRNGWAGIRTATTMTNDDTWDAAHVAAAPAFVIGGLVQLLLAATALVLAGNDDLNGAGVAIVFTVVWLVTLTAAVAMAAVVGVRASKAVLVRQQQHWWQSARTAIPPAPPTRCWAPNRPVSGSAAIPRAQWPRSWWRWCRPR